VVFMSSDLTSHLAEQLDWHWTRQLRPRLDGLTDDEYFFEPVPGCWTLRRDGPRMIPDFAYPPPQPEPFTTIAWRMAHVIVGVLAARTHAHFGGPPPTPTPAFASSTTPTAAGWPGCAASTTPISPSRADPPRDRGRTHR
jgi:hypothetical protein